MKDTIFIDFDGVVRLWTGLEIQASEHSVGVEKGTLLSIAFAPEFLEPAVIGKISHEEWIKNVGNELTRRYSDRISLELLSGWSNARWEINSELLTQLKAIAPQCKLVLVTNATTKLASDLESAGVASELDIVVNSAEIGTAKPDVRFYRKALSIAGTSAQKSLFIDDSESHIEAAVALGITSVQHKNNTDTVDFVKQNCT